MHQQSSVLLKLNWLFDLQRSPILTNPNIRLHPKAPESQTSKGSRAVLQHNLLGEDKDTAVTYVDEWASQWWWFDSNTRFLDQLLQSAVCWSSPTLFIYLQIKGGQIRKKKINQSVKEEIYIYIIYIILCNIYII